jgi:Leucine-rich repeat (LRR) protein
MDIYTNINNIPRDINYLLSITDMKCCSITNIFPKFLINLQHLNCEQVIHYIELPNSYKNLKSLYCQSAQIYDIPNTFINLEYLDCSYTAVEDIPITLINLEYLDCSYTEITFIPDTLVLLEYLNCSENIDLNKLPDTLINLITLNCNSTDIIDIPKTLINLTEIYSDKLDTNMIINRQKKIKNVFLKFIKLYKLYRISDTLWKIAEYYIARKYSPNYIIHYID